MRHTLEAYQAYLFDLDGTLIDTAPDINVALNYALRQFGLTEVTEDHTRHWIGHGGRVLIAEALKHQKVDEQQAEEMLPIFLDHYSEHHADLSLPYPTVVETLEVLKNNGAKLAVVTNKVARLSEQILDTLDMSRYFDVIVCGDTASAPKPDPAPVHYALDAMNMRNTGTLFVGDSNTDVLAARAAETEIVCVDYGYNQGQDVSTLAVDGVISSFRELLQAE